MKDEYQKITERIINDQAFRITLCLERFRWFAHTYFAHYLKYPSAPLHEEIYNDLEDWSTKFNEIIAFRGSAKSTISSSIFPIWAMITGKAKFILLASDTFTQAKTHIYNLKSELENNKLLINDFGPFQMDEEWAVTNIVIPKYDTRITAKSTGQKVRGIRHKQYRPDLLVMDDLENIESVRTKEGRDKTQRWVNSEVMPALERDAKVILIGSLLHTDCLMMRTKNQLEKGIRNGKLLFVSLLDKDKNIAWKGKYPTMKEIEIERAKIGNTNDWQREYLLKVISEEGQIVKKIHYYDKLPDGEPFFQGTGVDLAISKKSTADYTTMVSGKLYMIGENPKIYIMPNPVNERLDGLETTEKAKAISLALGNNTLTSLWVEDVSYQKMQIEAMERAGLPAEGVKVSTDKRARLITVSSYIANGTVVFPEIGCEDLIIQLQGFGVEAHDDLVDAIVYLIQALMNSLVQEPRITII